MIYVFDACTLDVAGRELWRAGRSVRLERQVFSVLVYLLQQRARVVPKRELLDRLWEGTCVSEAALSYSIAALRRATGDDGREQRIVRTHHRVGYRFVAQVSEHTGLDLPEWRGDNAAEPRDSSPG
jgi:DNA-binding winged helix-turn-helix (wHTH) protein